MQNLRHKSVQLLKKKGIYMEKVSKWIVVILIAYFIFVVASPIIFTQQTPQWLIDIFGKKIVFSSNSGNIGDTIGIMNPFVGIFAAVITFVAFWVQYKANDVL